MAAKNDQLTVVQPHKKISRLATDKDCELIMDLTPKMMTLCSQLIAVRAFTEIYALHHSQISKRPIDFFVINTNSKRAREVFDLTRNHIFVNAKIIKHTNHPIEKKEGCVSFPGKLPVLVERWHKIVCEYQYPVRQDDGTYALSEVQTEDMSGVMAQVVQHEIDHANAKFVYPLK